MDRKKTFLPTQKPATMIPLPTDLMNGQALGAVSGMKFGLGSIGKCGCEVIAVYNALLIAGCPRPLTEIARYMERFSMLGGLWGTDPHALGHCLRHFGLNVRRLRSHESVRRVLQTGSCCVYVYWTKRRMASAIHTVCMEQKGEKLWIYNAYNNVPHAIQSTPDAYLQGRRMILAYEIIPQSA